ncbi:hypothetical protein [Parasphingorhabdus sp.]|uniref:hypothetical protein n=1 Tax=Parasphingorhabdus sp. TaxID=2709688 RepID=UPI003264B8F7
MLVETDRFKSDVQDPGPMLTKQIKALGGDQAQVCLKRKRPWASITFSGTRHSFAVISTTAPDSKVIEELARALPDHEFAIPDHFVADILITEQTKTQLQVEILSIIDPIN